jgi:hypothetical protein
MPLTRRTDCNAWSKNMIPQPNASIDGITREELHHRQIDMRGYRRSVGLFEATAHLTDRKTSDFTPPDRSLMVAQSPLHDRGVTLVFDMDMVVREIGTFIRSHPYAHCLGGGATLQSLVGLRIGPRLEQRGPQTPAVLRYLYPSDGISRPTRERGLPDDGWSAPVVAR